jgi:hypothetical protein
LSTVADLAALILRQRATAAAQMRSCMLKIEQQHGSRLLAEAVKLAEQQALRQSLSISGQQQRARQRHQDERIIQRSHREKD